ncbi:MAG: FliH/SctL family protein [Syntrophaceae bacterium]|nr:FliH/SctL family protein [Syntrophaceae bacterium]
MKMFAGRVIKSQNVQYVNPAKQMPAKPEPEAKRPPSPDPALLKRIKDMKEQFAGQLQQAVREAHEKGAAEGIQQGIQQGRELEHQASLQVLRSMQQAIGEAAALKGKIIADAEEQIAALSLAIAEKILHTEVTANGEVVRNVVREAIKNLADRENMKIRLNPLDFHAMVEIKNDFIQNFDGIKNIIFEEDEGIQRGGAVIETQFGEADARLDQQFLEVKAAFQAPDVPEGG